MSISIVLHNELMIHYISKNANNIGFREENLIEINNDICHIYRIEGGNEIILRSTEPRSLGGFGIIILPIWKPGYRVVKFEAEKIIIHHIYYNNTYGCYYNNREQFYENLAQFEFVSNAPYHMRELDTLKTKLAEFSSRNMNNLTEILREILEMVGNIQNKTEGEYLEICNKMKEAFDTYN